MKQTALPGLDKPRYPGTRILLIDDASQPSDAACLLTTCGYDNVLSLTGTEHLHSAIEGYEPHLLIFEADETNIQKLDVLNILARTTPQELPVIVFAQDNNPELKLQALSSGASDYLARPLDWLDVLPRINNLVHLQRLQSRLGKRNQRLEVEVHEATLSAERAQMEILTRLAHLMDRRSSWLGAHNWRVARLSGQIALAMGFERDYADDLMRAARLHDVGKLALPEYIFESTNELSEEDRKAMESHTLTGAHVLSGGTTNLLQMAENVALTHHERWDGTGYPHGLKGEETPLEGRIVAVADAFDALTTPRPYRQPITATAALVELKRNAGTQFDPQVIDAFGFSEHEPEASATTLTDREPDERSNYLSQA